VIFYIIYFSTLDSFAQIVAAPLLADNMLINFARSYVIVSVKSDVEEALIIS